MVMKPFSPTVSLAIAAAYRATIEKDKGLPEIFIVVPNDIFSRSTGKRVSPREMLTDFPLGAKFVRNVRIRFRPESQCPPAEVSMEGELVLDAQKASKRRIDWRAASVRLMIKSG